MCPFVHAFVSDEIDDDDDVEDVEDDEDVVVVDEDDDDDDVVDVNDDDDDDVLGEVHGLAGVAVLAGLGCSLPRCQASLHPSYKYIK